MMLLTSLKNPFNGLKEFVNAVFEKINPETITRARVDSGPSKTVQKKACKDAREAGNAASKAVQDV